MQQKKSNILTMFFLVLSKTQHFGGKEQEQESAVGDICHDRYLCFLNILRDFDIVRDIKIEVLIVFGAL